MPGSHVAFPGFGPPLSRAIQPDSDASDSDEEDARSHASSSSLDSRESQQQEQQHINHARRHHRARKNRNRVNYTEQRDDEAWEAQLNPRASPTASRGSRGSGGVRSSASDSESQHAGYADTDYDSDSSISGTSSVPISAKRRRVEVAENRTFAFMIMRNHSRNMLRFREASEGVSEEVKCQMEKALPPSGISTEAWSAMQTLASKNRVAQLSLRLVENNNYIRVLLARNPRLMTRHPHVRAALRLYLGWEYVHVDTTLEHDLVYIPQHDFRQPYFPVPQGTKLVKFLDKLSPGVDLATVPALKTFMTKTFTVKRRTLYRHQAAVKARFEHLDWTAPLKPGEDPISFLLMWGMGSGKTAMVYEMSVGTDHGVPPRTGIQVCDLSVLPALQPLPWAATVCGPI